MSDQVPMPEPVSIEAIIADTAEALGVTVATVERYITTFDHYEARHTAAYQKAMQEREHWEFEVTGVVPGFGGREQ